MDIMSGGDANREGSEHLDIRCPVCSGGMEKKKYHRSCPIEIDECELHGIWLDTGEIKDLQVFIESYSQFE